MTSMIQIQINNIVTKSALVPPFSLSPLLADFYSSSQPPFSHVSLPSPHGIFSIFLSGSVILRASGSLAEVDASLKWLQSFLFDFNLQLSERYEIINVAAFSDSTPPLDLVELATHLLGCSYDPSPVDSNLHEYAVNAIVFYFDPTSKPRRTALIFPTGSVTFTGFKSIPDLEFHAAQLSSMLSQIAQNHPEVLAK